MGAFTQRHSFVLRRHIRLLFYPPNCISQIMNFPSVSGVDFPVHSLSRSWIIISVSRRWGILFIFGIKFIAPILWFFFGFGLRFSLLLHLTTGRDLTAGLLTYLPTYLPNGSQITHLIFFDPQGIFTVFCPTPLGVIPNPDSFCFPSPRSFTHPDDWISDSMFPCVLPPARSWTCVCASRSCASMRSSCPPCQKRPGTRLPYAWSDSKQVDLTHTVSPIDSHLEKDLTFLTWCRASLYQYRLGFPNLILALKLWSGLWFLRREIVIFLAFFSDTAFYFIAFWRPTTFRQHSNANFRIRYFPTPHRSGLSCQAVFTISLIYAMEQPLNELRSTTSFHFNRIIVLQLGGSPVFRFAVQCFFPMQIFYPSICCIGFLYQPEHLFPNPKPGLFKYLLLNQNFLTFYLFLRISAKHLVLKIDIAIFFSVITSNKQTVPWDRRKFGV